MRTRAELDIAMAELGFRPDRNCGGYRRAAQWVSAAQARGALAAAEADISWTSDDVEPLSESLARSLTQAGIPE